VAVAADHPWRRPWPRAAPPRRTSSLCKQGGTTAAELETAEKLGFDTGITARTRSPAPTCRSTSPTSC
jgi:leucyl-tRNA synthetase